jgi:hypothetical protein
MADNVSAGVANSILDAMLNGNSFAGFVATYAQLHNGAPGGAGTANVANSGTRQPAGTFSATSGGASHNSAAINWTSVAANDTYTHVTLWSAPSGGTFIASGSVTAGAILAGQNFSIPASGMSVTLPVAS